MSQNPVGNHPQPPQPDQRQDAPGLCDQHAVENQAIELLTRQVKRLENYPEMEARRAAGQSALKQSLGEEIDVAQWLDQHLADTALRFLQRSDAGLKAGL